MNRKAANLIVTLTFLTLALAVMPSTPAAAQDVYWSAEYYANMNLEGAPACVGQFDYVNIAVDWEFGGPQDCPEVGVDGFSVRWIRWFSFDEGHYRFWAATDDGVRVYVDGDLVIDEWFPRQPGWTTAERDVSADRWHLVTVEYFDESGNAEAEVFWEFVEGSRAPGPERRGEDPPGPGGTGAMAGAGPWHAQFYNSINLTGDVVLERMDDEINFNWGYQSPAPGVVWRGYFSARWERTAYFDAGEWEFSVRCDDGARLYIDDQLVINRWYSQWAHTYKTRQQLTAGNHSLRVEYFEQEEVALIQVSWQQIGVPVTPTPSPTDIVFTVDRTQINAGECVNITWNVQNAQQVYYENQPVSGAETRNECPTTTHIYTLRVVRSDGTEEIRTVTVAIMGGGYMPPMGTGDVQITLNWNNTANLDLHVVDPTGYEIYSGAPVAPTGGRLELDANALCYVATPNPVENIYWPTGTAPSGQYGVSVHYKSPCFGEGPATYTITVRNNGVVITTQTGVIALGQYLDLYTFTR
jgi:hypothetical protein